MLQGGCSESASKGHACAALFALKTTVKINYESKFRSFTCESADGKEETARGCIVLFAL